MNRRRHAWTTLALCLAGCADRTGERPATSAEPLLIFAASSLDRVMPEIVDRFAATSPARVEVVFGATGNLAAQIENGAPGDVFLAADEATVEDLAKKGLLRASSVRTYAVGQLALVWSDEVSDPASVAAITAGAYEVIAIANPEHAPYGAAAKETLERLGIWEALEPRVVYGENIAQALQLVRTGNADVGFVSRSALSDTSSAWLPVDPALHAPIRQAAGVLEQSTRPEAEAFLAFVSSDEGQAILASHGFGPG